MRNRFFFLAIAISLFSLTACKKDSSTMVIAPEFANTPPRAYPFPTLASGGTIRRIAFMDLSSTNVVNEKIIQPF